MNETILRDKANADSRAGAKSRARTRRIHLELTDDNVAVVTFGSSNKTANVLDEATLDELHLAVSALESLKPDGVLFTSSSDSIFIAGADLKTLANINGERLEHLVVKGQSAFSRIADLPMPTVAAIHGACVGGGFELALACDARVASRDKATRIGLPETMLGILPAWGGSTRLPRLVGVPAALDAILSGKLYRAGHAGKLGFVDAVVPREHLLESGMRILREGAPFRKKPFWKTNRIVSAFVSRVVRRKVLKKSRGNYPALLEAIEVVSRGAAGPVDDSLNREREAVLRLADTPEAKNLMRLFFLQENAKRFRFSESVDEENLPAIERVAVIGAGVMGAGIAQWVASRNIPVLLRDIDRGRVAAGMENIRKLFSAATKRRIFSAHEARSRMDLISPSAEPVSLKRSDLVIEAAVEDLAVKETIFADLCERTRPDTILATNTSALPISDLGKAEGVTHPERIIGLHFFNPVSRMKLVEVVVTDFTSPEVVERSLNFVRSIGKLPVVVKDSPGFLVNRILMPYLIEAGRLVDDGYAPEYIDEAMLDFGMPMGPVRLIDEVGLDVAGHVAATMREAFGDRFELPKCLGDYIRDGRLGRKSGHGFYRYDDGRAVKGHPGGNPAEAMSKPELSDHLAGLMAKEARLCLDEGVAKCADDIDFAMILGTGFAPFRGGPLTWSGITKND